MLLNDRYRILDTLGRGGFGETYLVEDRHLPSKRKCVLKQLNPIVEQSETPSWMKERFQREAAILEELGDESKQIPRLYAYFAEEGKFYLVQEWIEGETLAQKHQRQGNLNSQQVQAILAQLLPVLDFLHQRQIIHRDLKPENIILRQSDRLPVLIDFGAVKEAMSTQANHSNNSSLSISIGTPGYMASEQAAGRPAYSSDLYSLGLTAIFLLTGKSPQDLETDPETGEIIWQEYAKNLDPKLVLVLDKAIQFHPRDRFNSAAAMLSALDNRQKSHPTVQVAPAVSHREQHSYAGTVHYENHTEQSRTGSNRLVKIFLFLLTLAGLGIGTFAVGFTLIANLLPSFQKSSPQAQVEPDDSSRRPILFPSRNEEKIEISEEEPEVLEDNAKTESEIKERKIEIEKIAKARKEESIEQPKTPDVFVQTQPNPESPSATDKPILTTGVSEAQLVSTLGKPTSQRTDFRENSKVLEYRDSETDKLNSRYKANTSGKIYYTEVILDSSNSLGQMQTALDQLLGNNNSASIKDKLRAVYNRTWQSSFFKVGNLEGKIERDSKDRISISVQE
ncbi:serine/threonine protein kinase [Xenococcus sp. PCC 7305]|uniref:serine/threonine-protein kinase n=1 Tax=Xenococcus sp. PCC 7305 TaxID=102125 RepID=UPI0002ABCD5B|nr:serine/threonine-protein kinase [Xenococcus sp. PCC 7305]ELS01061.1 serine/threonine protein kinase [Xenococcus sp. PCC 7305]